MKKTLLLGLLLAAANFSNAQTDIVLEDFNYTITDQASFIAAIGNFEFGGPDWALYTGSTHWIHWLDYTATGTNLPGVAGFAVGEKVAYSSVFAGSTGTGPTGTTPKDSVGGYIAVNTNGNFSAGNTYKVKFDVSPSKSETYDVLDVDLLEFDGVGAFVSATSLGSKTFVAADYGKQTLEYDITLPTTLTNQFYIAFNHSVTALSPNNQTPGGHLGGIILDKVILVQTAPLSSADFENTNFSIYPNPAKDFLNVNSKLATIQSVVVSDINGRTVKNVAFNQTNVQVNVSDLNAGIYMVTINSEEGSTVKKFVKK
jgi:hypothetical protein